MAQAGSAQREPSMEEILASIRRIIEDSDTGRKPYDEAEPSRYDFGAARDEPASPEPARQELPPRADNPVIEVDAFRAELRAGLAEPRKLVTLAEIQAQIAAETPKKVEPAPAAMKVEAAAPAVETSAPLAAEARGATQSPVAEWTPAPAKIAEAEELNPARDKAMDAEFKKTMDAVFEDISAGQSSPPPAPDSAPQHVPNGGFIKPAIISEHAGRQVAAAFGELSEAFAARSKKTFDDIAEEMMRPMLQDWLDNNLPMLVERLVREEIERVARGAQ